ncbi:DUF5067 domain-containing protein [Corynebacterium sp. H128]|uniref:DUF5067 domain-containing protein n=1 Tax=Corynebacterium sp. H128 TaxID=3133427 RepID=UPI0030ADF85A
MKTPSKLAIAALFMIAPLTLAACGSGDSEPEAKKETQATTADKASGSSAAKPAAQPSGKPGFADSVLETEDFVATITETKVIPAGEKGNTNGNKPVVAFYYDMTSKSADDVVPGVSWTFVVTAYQGGTDESNEIEIAPNPDDNLALAELAAIKQGESHSNIAAYYLNDETTPVTLVASEDLGFTELGKQNFEVK